MHFYKPPQFATPEGTPRRVGFELEFGNIAVQDAATALHTAFGGTLHEENPFVYTLRDSAIGKIKIERDAQLLNTVKYRDLFSKFGVDFTRDMVVAEVEKGIDRLSSGIIPCEAVTAPLAYEDFSKLHQLIRALEDLHAEGTQDSIFNAFGLHLNPSAPDLTPATLVRYIQAYLLLDEWIVDTADIDFTRRYLTSYIDPFPTEYRVLVLHEDYAPDTGTFIRDYLRLNATRNRGLDLLPMLAEIDRDAVEQALPPEEHGLVGARPAFHYRLPDCRIGDADWSVAAEWNRWWHVEVLAQDDELRRDLMRLWHKTKDEFLLMRRQTWVERVSEFIDTRFPAPQETAASDAADDGSGDG